MVLRTSFCKKLSRFYLPFWDQTITFLYPVLGSNYHVFIYRFGIKLSRFYIPFWNQTLPFLYPVLESNTAIGDEGEAEGPSGTPSL